MAHPIFRCPACNLPIEVDSNNVIQPHNTPPLEGKMTIICCRATGQQLVIGCTCENHDEGGAEE